jgi:hypothetical protein
VHALRVQSTEWGVKWLVLYTYGGGGLWEKLDHYMQVQSDLTAHCDES